MDIFITMLNGTSHPLKVSPDETVGSLKKRIEQQINVSTARQKLIFTNGSNTPLNDDSKPLSFYNLQSGSRVNLLVTQPSTFQVFLKNDKGTTSTYDITKEETVDSFKKRVQEREGVPENQQRLNHEGKEMQSGYKLSDYKVRELSTIFLMLRLRGG